MRLEVLDDRIIVHETGRQNNGIEYDSSLGVEKYNRRRLSYIETFLIKSYEFKEAEKIRQHLGKIIRLSEVPKLIPTNNYYVNQPLDSLLERIEHDVARGLDLNPDFQRGHVWNIEQRIAFVEFVLQGGKPNPIFFNHEGWMKSFDGEYVVVDGKQRLTSMMMFLRNEFTVFKNLDSEGIGYYAREFDMLGRYDLVFLVNDLQNRELVLQWYLQLNKGNIQHSDEEIKRVENMLKELKGETL